MRLITDRIIIKNIIYDTTLKANRNMEMNKEEKEVPKEVPKTNRELIRELELNGTVNMKKALTPRLHLVGMDGKIIETCHIRQDEVPK